MGFLQEATNWVLISFVIFAAGFAYKGWNIILAKLDGRIEEIKAEITAAEKLHAEAAEMLEDYRAKHREAMNEAKEISARARIQSESIREKAETDLKETLARREKQLQERLKRIEQSAEAELRAATAEIALKASETLIRKGLDAKAQSALVDKSVSAVSAI